MNRFVRYVLASMSVVPVCVVAAMALAVLQLINQIPVYESHAVIAVPEPAPDATHDSYDILRSTWSRKILATPVSQAAFERLQRPRQEARELLDGVHAVPVGKSALVRLTVRSFDPVYAAELANAWADVSTEILSADVGLPFSVMQRATPASRPAGPGSTQILFTWFVLGAVVGMGLALALAAVLYVARKENTLNS